MSKAYEFLKECGAFFVLSINGDYPAGRPFGAVMEVGDDLYLSTNDMNDAHKQMRENEHIQIVAKKVESREWIRITGIATECDNQALKQRMLEECPILQQRFGAVGMEHFIMFKVKVENVYDINGKLVKDYITIPLKLKRMEASGMDMKYTIGVDKIDVIQYFKD